MKKVYFLVLFLLLRTVCADVIIDEVLYDPSGSESDTEFVELYNNGPDEANISNWKLNTSSVQAEIPRGTFISANTSFLIADEDDSGAWQDEWDEPDFIDELTLTNTDSGVQLMDNMDNKIDVVGWGNPVEALYEGTAHSGSDEGYSLCRDNHIDTDDNSADFSQQHPSPENSVSHGGEEIQLHAAIQGNPPKIVYMTLNGESSIELMPIPGSFVTLSVEAVVVDYDQDLASATANLDQVYDMVLIQQLNSTHFLYQTNISMPFHYTPGNHTVEVFVNDGSGSDNASALFEYLSVAAFEVDTQSVSFTGMAGSVSEVIGDLDFETPEPTIHNIGNTQLDFSVSGTDLEAGNEIIDVSNVEYSFLDSDFNCSESGVLSESGNTVSLDLIPGAFREFSLRLLVPSQAALGDYSGTLYLTGVSS